MRAPTLDILLKLMKPTGRAWLLMAAAVSFFVAVLHVVIVLIGPSAYSFFGGQRLARLAESGSSSPVIQTLSLAAVHTLFGSYALAGAGVIRRLPLLTVVLFAIGGMYAFRGLSAIEQALQLLRDPDSLPDSRPPLFPRVLRHRLRLYCGECKEMGMASRQGRDRSMRGAML
jgi:hypothetical protein